MGKDTGGVDIDAREVSVGGDVTGRDKTVSAGGDVVGRDKIIQGDEVHGDKVGGDKVMGDKVTYEAPAPIVQRLHQLPPPPRDFTGRADELAELTTALGRGITITGLRGMGGIGKTALALKLAEGLLDRYPDAQFYLDLHGTDPKPFSPTDAMLHIIRAYNSEYKPPESEAELKGQYYSTLHNQRALLLMDNAADRAQVEPLLPPSSCLLLITSRQHFALPGLYAKDLNVMPEGEAQALLLRIAERINGHSGEMARLCGYLPLALRVSASTLAERKTTSVESYLARLSEASKRLELVEASLDASYSLLAPDLQRLWRSLAVFPATFDLAAAAAVWEIGQDSAAEALDELVRYSLVDWNENSGRYNLHDLARLFAEARMGDNERYEMRSKHAAHYERVLRFAKELYKQGGDNILHGLALYDLEQTNIQAGFTWVSAHTGQDNVVAQLCSDYAGAGSLLNLRLPPCEYIGWLKAALTAARRVKNRSDEGTHLGNLGSAYHLLGDARKAIELHEAELVIARETGNRRGEGACLGNLGLAYACLGDARKAIEYHEQALPIFRKIGDRRGEGAALCNLGNAYADLGDARKAIEYHKQALVILREIGDRRGEGQDLMNTGNAYYSLGDARQAIQYHEQALPIFREIGDRRSEGQDLDNLGIAYYSLGDVRKAIEYHEQALATARETGNRRGEGNALWNMSLSLDKLGERDKAIACAEAALMICEQIENPNTEKVRRQLEQWRSKTR